MCTRPSRLQRLDAVHRRDPSGNQTVRVNQRVNGGQWLSLGVFTLAAGDGDKVGVSRWTTGTGYVIADAVRITRV